MGFTTWLETSGNGVGIGLLRIQQMVQQPIRAAPCPANTAIIDFEGNPKPAALAIKAILTGQG